MFGDNLKESIRKGDTVLGTFLFTPSPSVMEILGYAGFDFAIIDTEHAPVGSVNTVILENIIRAANIAGITPLVRLPENSRTMTQKALDSGANGVVVPGIRTKDDTIQMLRNTKYPPEGDRGCCYLTRATKYTSAYNTEYWSKANQNTMAVPLIENKEAVENLEEIISVKGIDFIFFGPRDFSMSLGHVDVNNPETKRTRKYVEDLCEQKNMPLARFLYPPFEESVKKSINEGAQILIAGADVALLYQTTSKIAQIVRDETK